MFIHKCFCGKGEQKFKMNLGGCYHDDCCEAAGYNHLGQLKEKPKEIEPIPQTLPKEEPSDSKKRGFKKSQR